LIVYYKLSKEFPKPQSRNKMKVIYAKQRVNLRTPDCVMTAVSAGYRRMGIPRLTPVPTSTG